MDRQQTLDAEFLEIRARLLQLAAALDRIDRADGAGPPDPRLDAIHQALTLLDRPTADRAEAIQLVFSRPYDPNWRAALGVGETAPPRNGAPKSHPGDGQQHPR